ncbi:uncharacterized protein row [Tribolium castaneum]|uniref:C2H2-type domain-containing protein n=1 Tax=Tribolium castaneum TaxID=7070 RepID=D6WLR3_TRICA|nr:PREDICTED: uncharacterized protein LOC661798 [Tribolium castaneum]EFA04153.1 hypothetical protein TcasGA2_TC014398 [Tribolium castaneum]|eukprot:XP_973030.2 PREDICTED: uncharacterized protein LOC661798 [Tribolium castaneum]
MPKEKQLNRTQSRRAASKEALKQMHLLLGADNNKYEISSDDDVIEVEVQPPKKKYKLSHRKSSDGNDRDVIVLKPVDESVFDLEVVVEDLAPSQKSRLELLQKETNEVETTIQQLLTAPNTEVVYNGVYTTAVEITEQIQTILSTPTPAAASTAQFTITNQTPLAAPTPVQQPVASQSLVLQQQPPSANNAIPQSYQLVMDPRLGVIVGAVSTSNASPNTPPLLYQPKVAIPAPGAAAATESPAGKGRRGPILRQVPANAIPPLAKVSQKTPVAANKTQNKIQVKPMLGKAVQPKQNVVKTIPASPKPIPIKGRPPTTSTSTNFRPTESNVEGGLSMGAKPSKSIDLTGEDGRALPDSREVSFNKLQGRTYPSLVVVARPHLRVKDLAADRSKLDVKVKSVLMYPPTKFTEWLIQQGLVRSDQKCSVHTTNPLKLGMYSDASKFPYSGGYVWISECCPQRFVSVFSGSIFEGSQHPPMSILKLLYHWCCQTIVQNVTQWVKVDNLYVKGMYTWLRSVCTVAIYSHIKQLGGPGVKVQIGVISLGTTSQDGNKREVKVEVLGILETTTRHIRLRAVEPLSELERNYKKRFSKILEPVFNWVHPQSIIVTDLTVDKNTLHQLGFLHVQQNTSNDYANSNRTIMEYLRRIVPRMFQNTLSLLSRPIIQQFLDELVWREWYGTTVLQCFDNMVKHISEQTRFDSGSSLINRLNKVSANPFKNWSITTYTTSTPSKPVEPAPKRYSRLRKPQPSAPAPPPVQEVVRPSKSHSPDVPEQMVPLENYYYGTISPTTPSKNNTMINIKCPFCKLTFNTNISLMNHLFKHAHNVSNDVQLCKYCLTIVPSANDLLKHINTAHPDETKFDNGFVCLICESHFRNPFILGKHLSREHNPSELPYLCGTCGFRCSNHKQAVDHFYQQHDRGTTIQCPFCLKSTTIYSGGRNISQNMNYFIQHLQKHQKKQLAKRCGKCTLWFIQKEFLKDHQIKMHASQRGKPGLVPAFAPRNGVMVPKSKMDKWPDDAKVINFSTLYFNVNKNLNCKECGQSLSSPKHFASFDSCQNPNCQFSTCCTTAMQNHVAKCKFLNSKLPAEKLPYEMFCICGYSDTDGNMLAKHLAICERKSAYPSQEAAKEATVTHSMLDVLGLVRKPEEATSSKDDLPRLIPTRSEPIILKRGRPRKHPVPPKEVIEVKDDEEPLSISEVRGGVKIEGEKHGMTEIEEIKESENKDVSEKQKEVQEDKSQVGQEDHQEKGTEEETSEVVDKEQEDHPEKEIEEEASEVGGKGQEEDQGKEIEEETSEVVDKGQEDQQEKEIAEETSEVVDKEQEDQQEKNIEKETSEIVKAPEDQEEKNVEEETSEVIDKVQEDPHEEEEKTNDIVDKGQEDHRNEEVEETTSGIKEQEDVQQKEAEDDSGIVDNKSENDEVKCVEEEEIKEHSAEARDNESVSENTKDVNELQSETVESESMEVDSCNASETVETVAIGNQMEKNSETIDDICPMDTD